MGVQKISACRGGGDDYGGHNVLSRLCAWNTFSKLFGFAFRAVIERGGSRSGFDARKILDLVSFAVRRVELHMKMIMMVRLSVCGSLMQDHHVGKTEIEEVVELR